MAEGGHDFPKMDEMEGIKILLKLAKNNKEDSKTSFNNTVDDNNDDYYDDDNINEYNPGVTLSDNTSFTSPISAATAALLTEELTFTVNEDKLKHALDGSGWKYTDTGIRLLSAKVRSEGNKLIFNPTQWEIDTLFKKPKKDKKNKLPGPDGKSLDYIIYLTKSNGKFYSESTLKKDYGTPFLNQIKNILKMPNVNVSLQHTPMVIQPQATTAADSSFIENIVDSPKPINRLIDATEDELKSLGFTDNAIRELRGLVKSGVDLAAVKRDKDMIIQEMKERLYNVENELLKTTEENIDLRYSYIKEKEELQDKHIIEHKKVFDLDNDRESRTSRIKRLITDVLKKPDSQISLKDRLKILFKLEGFTIAAIIAAITMFFTTIGLAISNSLRSKSGGGSAPSPPSPDKPPSIPDRVREGLKKFAEWLKELAKKAAGALPGIIGSIVSFLLKSAAAAVGFLSEHLVILIFIVVSSVIYGLIEGVKTIKKSSK